MCKIYANMQMQNERQCAGKHTVKMPSVRRGKYIVQINGCVNVQGMHKEAP